MVHLDAPSGEPHRVPGSRKDATFREDAKTRMMLRLCEKLLDAEWSERVRRLLWTRPPDQRER
jgi:hypothetical protein